MDLYLLRFTESKVIFLMICLSVCIACDQLVITITEIFLKKKVAEIPKLVLYIKTYVNST